MSNCFGAGGLDILRLSISIRVGLVYTGIKTFLCVGYQSESINQPSSPEPRDPPPIPIGVSKVTYDIYAYVRDIYMCIYDRDHNSLFHC